MRPITTYIQGNKMELVTIQNSSVKVEIQILGGAFYTITDKRNGEQLVWEGEEGLWSARDHVMFPFVCRRVDGKYLDGGNEYDMPLHGFVRDMKFTVAKKRENYVKLTVCSTPQTLKHYPHEFEISVIYSLDGDEISVDYEIVNIDGNDMYFSFGGHLGLKAITQSTERGEDTKGNYVTFNPPLDTIYNLSEGAFVLSPSVIKPIERLEVDKDFIRKYETLILQTKQNSTLLYERGDGVKIKFTVPSPIIALWTEENRGGFCCIEPWWGLPDSLPLNREIEKKPLMCKVNGNGIYKAGYKIEIIR